ncbi:1858_t:CDS:10, partial [Diversispora eburnea]
METLGWSDKECSLELNLRVESDLVDLEIEVEKESAHCLITAFYSSLVELCYCRRKELLQIERKRIRVDEGNSEISSIETNLVGEGEGGKLFQEGEFESTPIDLETDTTCISTEDGSSDIFFDPLTSASSSSSPGTSSKKVQSWYLDVGEPTEMINVKKFLDSFSTELRLHEENIQKDLKYSDKLNKKQNPTIFCLLRQYHSGSKNNPSSPSSLSVPPPLPVHQSVSSSSTTTNDKKKFAKGKNKEIISYPQNNNHQSSTISQKRKLDASSSDKIESRSSKSSRVSRSDSEDGSEIRPEPSALELRFWEMTKELDNSSLASLKEENRTKVSSKTRNEMNYMANKNYKEPHTAPKDIVNTPEVILSVAFYNQNKPSTRMQEFLVLGNQPLTALRDAFYCLRDFYKVTPWEKPTQNSIVNSTEKKTSSSYFFIEKVFYNDLRDPRAIDYSKNVIDWVKENDRYKQRGLGLYTCKKMENVKFNELSIRIMQSYDDPDVSAYPKAIFKGKINRHKCRMCMQRPTLLVTINDFLSGESPAYFCDRCYYQFHYNSKNELLYDNFQ